MGCGSSQPASGNSKGGATPAKHNVQDRLSPFTCHVHVASPASPSSLSIHNSSDIPHVELKQKDGSSTKYDTDCIFDGSAGDDIHGYYSANVSPIIKSCYGDKNNGSNALLMTIGRNGAGKTQAFYGQKDSDSGGIVRLVCQEMLGTFGSEQDLLSLSLICVPTGKTEKGAYDCLANNPSSKDASPPLFETATDAKIEIAVKSLDDVEKVLKHGNAVTDKAASYAHTLLTLTIRLLDGSGNVVKSSRIKMLDLCGDVPSFKSNGSGGSDAKGGRGGRGGRKGGRGWSSYDTRKGSAPDDEDRTVRAIRRIVDFLSRRFKNVPYQDSILTTLLQGELEGTAIIAFVCIKGRQDDDKEEASTWHAGTAHVLEFMNKLRGITVSGAATSEKSSGGREGEDNAERVREVMERSGDWLTAC